ncbi:MAG TPA: NAD(P)H-dependent oxidoreductase subunit E [Beijerinckiaceae bacterium]|nr:NAD(P)H-dependent oxidoreductase subunit E [Beijerinckiaceae bacterium]
MDDSTLERPKAGKGRRWQTRGRIADPAAARDIDLVLGHEPVRRDHLIEYLHRIQDRFGALMPRHLKALADRMRLSEVEVFEVASFYHHFDIRRDDDAGPAAITIRVCDSVSCMLAGGEALVERLTDLVDPAHVRIMRAPCIGRCAEAPAALIGKRAVGHATAERLRDLAAAGTVTPEPVAATRLAEYQAAGGYRLLASMRSGALTPAAITEALSDAGLRGLGGAGFPAGRKWSIVRSFPAPRLMTINADEGEPGTFKDRCLLEADPHRVLEGALIAAQAVEAERIYLYLRDEYAHLHQLLGAEIDALARAELIKPGFIELRRGAGAYVCGEESAMLASIEGRRGLPRHRPPYIAEAGLFGRPTLNHNVETLYWIRDILDHGAEWFAGQGLNGARGLRSFSVSGRVRFPGLKRAPAGITLRELVDQHCGGMAEGHRLAGYLPGGASGGMLPASRADLPLEFGRLEPHGCFIGSHAIVVFSDQDDPAAIALNLMQFFRHESCGQCTPCRLGTEKLVALMEQGALDRALVADIDHAMREGSICGLGQAAPNPLACLIRYFPEALR